MDDLQSAEFPRKTLLVTSAIGALTMLTVGIVGHGMPESTVWPVLAVFALVTFIEVLAVPPAISRLPFSPQLRTKKNVLSTAVAVLSEVRTAQ